MNMLATKESLSKEIGNIKKQQIETLDMKNTVTEINVTDGLGSRMEKGEERISELGDGIEMT